MTHVLLVAALQLSHPVPFLVLMETDDALLHVITKPARRTLRHPERVAIPGPALPVP